MNWTQIEGKWEQFKGRARAQWGMLTDDDLQKLKGNRDELRGKIVERYGIAREQADEQIERWLSTLDDATQHRKN